MSERHEMVTILPAADLEASTAFYQRLGLTLDSDWGDYRIFSDGRGWHLHLRHTPGWPATPEDNPNGLYVYVADVDAVAERVREAILHPGKPERKPWGCYEFAVSDPCGTLVRVGKIL